MSKPQRRFTSTRPSRRVDWARLLVQLALTFVGSAALLWPALDNGYPLAWQDSNWYLRPVFGGEVHPGRAVGYSLLARLAMMVPTVWSLVVVQSLVTSALLVRVCVVAMRRSRDGLALAALALVVVLVLSGGAKYVSGVMADVMTGWLFLAGALWMLSSRRLDRAAVVVVLALSLVGHNTHVPLALATSAVVAACACLLPAAGRRGRRAAIGLLVLAFLAVPWSLFANATMGSGPGVLRGTSSFLAHRFIDTGVLGRTLDTYCEVRDWKSCGYREEFQRQVGRGGGWFLFHEQSPFRTELGAWEGEEQAELVAHAFRCCSGQIATTTLVGAWRQFWSVDSRTSPARRDTGPLMALLRRHEPGDVSRLRRSRQHSGLPVRVVVHPVPEAALQAVFLIAAIGLAAASWRRGPRKATFLLASLGVFLLANALICSLGSTLFHRYQGRVAWLLPYCITIAGWWKARERSPS